MSFIQPSHKCLGLARTIYIRCIHGVFGREIIKYTVYIYGSGQPYKCPVMQKNRHRGAHAWVDMFHCAHKPLQQAGFPWLVAWILT